MFAHRNYYVWQTVPVATAPGSVFFDPRYLTLGAPVATTHQLLQIIFSRASYAGPV